MDAAWSILKADPNVRMRANSPGVLGRASKTMHPAIAGMMQGIGDKRKEPIPKDMVSLQGRKTVSGSGHTYPYEFMDTHQFTEGVASRALGQPESTPGRSVSERRMMLADDKPFTPDEVVQSLRQDPSQNENFMRVFNEHMARQGRMGNPDGVQMVPNMMGQTSPAPPPADPEFMARIKADEEESQQRKTKREERKR